MEASSNLTQEKNLLKTEKRFVGKEFESSFLYYFSDTNGLVTGQMYHHT